MITVESMFEALSLCASLHPDPQEDMDDDDDEIFLNGDEAAGFQVFTGDADQELSEVGRVRSDFINNNRFQPY
jgi:chloride channel, nucleotide-sensitive, 1A